MSEKILQRLNELNQRVKNLVQDFMVELEKCEDVEVKHFPKNSFLVSKNEVNLNAYFIKKGCVRSFVHDADLNEVTIWFTFENQAIFSSTSYILLLPSSVMIQALEDVEAVVVSSKQLENLYKTKMEVNQWSRTIMENFMILLSFRTISLQTMLAEMRYHQLIDQNPDILQRVSLRHIASYIGVKTETLSRIRANYKIRT